MWDSGKDPGHTIITWPFDIQLFCKCLHVTKPKYFQVQCLFYYSIPNNSVAPFLPAYTLYTFFKTLRWLSFDVKQFLPSLLLLREEFCSTGSKCLPFMSQGNFITTDGITTDMQKKQI